MQCTIFCDIINIVKDSELLFGIMASLGRKWYKVEELLALCAPFSSRPGSLRTSLCRLQKKGVLVSRRIQGRSAYAFSAKGRRIGANVAAGFETADWQGWDGSYWGILLSLPSSCREERYRITKKLRAFRFAPFFPGFWIRPFRRSEHIKSRLESIFADPRFSPLRFKPHRPLKPDEAERLWKIDQAGTVMRKALSLAEAGLEKLSSASSQEAFAMRYRLGGELVQALFSDPLLPAEFLPADWPAPGLRRLFKRFDGLAAERSKPFWEGILGRDAAKEKEGT